VTASKPDRPTREHRLGPTQPALLFIAGLASAAVAWLTIERFFGQMPALPWLPTLTLGALAVFEAILAQNTRARIERRPGYPKVNSLAVARSLVLAKASSLAGAIFAGFNAGLLAWLLLDPRKLAREDIPAASVAFGVSIALIGAALWLERSCRVPDNPDDEQPRPRD
jgi:hypothetical protein